MSLFSNLGFGSLGYSPAGLLFDQWIQSNPLQPETACKVLASRGATIVRLPPLNVIAAYGGIIGRLRNSIGSRALLLQRRHIRATAVPRRAANGGKPIAAFCPGYNDWKHGVAPGLSRGGKHGRTGAAIGFPSG